MLLYRIGIYVYVIFVRIAALFGHKKAQNWVSGRSEQSIPRLSDCIWIHCSSLGEYEQAKPVLQKLRKRYPKEPIVLTYFSPSATKFIVKDNCADHVLFLPADTRKKRYHFLTSINPKIALFVKYDFWFGYLGALEKAQVPVIYFSSVFRPNQYFFKPWARSFARSLSHIDEFFVQDQRSKKLLEQIGCKKVTIAGDTRLERVHGLAREPFEHRKLEEWSAGKRLLIAGSTWEDDENLLAQSSWKDHFDAMIVAPHDVSEKRIDSIEKVFGPSAVRLSQIDRKKGGTVLIIDCIGLLSRLYRLGQVAYVGGGFKRSGLHNTLEPAAYGMPIVFGPNYTKFPEAEYFVQRKLGFSVTDQEKLNEVMRYLSTDRNVIKRIKESLQAYFNENLGASDQIVRSVAAYLTNSKK